MKLDHIALYVLDLEQARQFFLKYFNASANEMYHNPRTGLKTYFLAFAEGARLEIMQRPEVVASDFDPYRQGYFIFLSVLAQKRMWMRLPAGLKRMDMKC